MTAQPAAAPPPLTATQWRREIAKTENLDEIIMRMLRSIAEGTPVPRGAVQHLVVALESREP